MPYRLLLTIFSLLFISNHIPAQEVSPVKIKKVVIDAGHGGHDPGAVSINGRVHEKDITLSVALKLGSMIKEKYPDIKIIYTRSTDVFIPLNQRTEIANKNQANLFISIHVNSAKARAASGSETFVMGMDKSSSNLEVTMLENSVIALEGDVESKYDGFDPKNPESYIIFSLLQNAHLEQSLIMASLIQDQFTKGPIRVNRGIKQGGLLVLWKTTMPAVLVELGFISNSTDLPILESSDNQMLFAGNILKAFDAFKKQYEEGSKIEAPEYGTDISETKKETIADTISKSIADPAPAAKEQNVTEEDNSTSNSFFSIQILAVNKPLQKNAPDFKGIKDAQYIKVGKFYKYSVGKYDSLGTASGELGKIRRQFPGAFIIKVDKGNIVPF